MVLVHFEMNQHHRPLGSESSAETFEETRHHIGFCINDKMDVIIHQTIGINIYIIFLFAICHDVKKFLIVRIFFKDDMLINGAKYDMIYACRADNSSFSWH